MIPASGERPRHAYLDALRIGAAFLVVVNHTNSYVFQAAEPGALEWWLSILWYYLSKLAVPVFALVSGACLLGKTDSYRKVGWRFARALLALLLFSYLFYLYDAWVYYGLWPRALDLGAFFTQVWRMEILDDLWYLYLYLGLTLMLPLMQRLASAMRGRDALYLVSGCFALGALWPLITHYAPGLRLPPYFSAPMFAPFVGLFFAGHWLHRTLTANRKAVVAAGIALVASLILSALLTYLESFHAEKYWFMDDRTQPSLFTVVGACAAMILTKAALAKPAGERAAAALRELGGCAFGVYLWQGFWVAQTRHRLYEPLCALMPALCAALVWEVAVFAVSLALAWAMRRIPGIKKIL